MGYNRVSGSNTSSGSGSGGLESGNAGIIGDLEPVDNCIASVLGREVELTDEFKANYEKWLDREVFGTTIQWEQLLGDVGHIEKEENIENTEDSTKIKPLHEDPHHILKLVPHLHRGSKTDFILNFGLIAKNLRTCPNSS